MVRVTVFNYKSFFKYIRFALIVFISLACLFFLYNFRGLDLKIIANSNYYELAKHCLNENISSLKVSNASSNKFNNQNILEFILYSELPIINKSFLIEYDDTDSPVESPNDLQSIIYANENAKTEVIENNVPNKYTDAFNGVEIKNGTDYTLTDDILNPSSLNINKSDILIFHTHTCESYAPSEAYQYEETGTFRTTDLERNVVKVGSELTTYLLSYGFNAFHDTTYHDYPAYSGSYGRSMATVENLLISHPNTDIIIDLHRDAIGDTSYAPSVKIDNDVVAQLMFVIGTDGGGLEHPNWQNNLKFAITVQQKANELYPGLFRPILLRNSRYNQHLGNAACIIEVGATGNTLDQSLLSMKYLSLVLDKVLKN